MLVVGALVAQSLNTSAAADPASAAGSVKSTMSVITLPSPGGGSTEWTDLNDAGQVAGTYDTVGGPRPVAARWQNGTIVTLATPANALFTSGINGYGYAIDGSGDVFGTEDGGQETGGTTYARALPVYWSASGASASPFVGDYDGMSKLTAASENGRYTGGVWCGNNGRAYTPCQYVVGTGAAGGSYSFATVPVGLGSNPYNAAVAVNDSGLVAVGGRYLGTYSYPSYLLHGVNDTPTAAKIVFAGTSNELNDAGTVVGSTADHLPAVQAADGTVSTLPLLTTGDTGFASAINDNGDIVGTECPTSGTCFGVLWRNGTVTALTTLAPSADPSALYYPIDVNDDGWILTSKNTLLESAATVEVSIHPTVPKGGLSVGRSMSVPVTVRAVGGSLTNVSLSGLTLSGTAATITDTPTGTTGFSLDAGASRTFVYTVVGARPGSARLSTSVSASGPKGEALTAADSLGFAVAEKALKITMVSTPGTVRLDATDKGTITPKTISVRVRVANVTARRITDVRVLSLSPRPENRTQQLDKLAFAKSVFPIRIGTLAAKASAVRTLTLKVTGDGTYVIDALATYAEPNSSSGTGRVAETGATFTSTVPLLFYTAHSGNDRIAAGDDWTVSGQVRNLSSFQTVCLSPLYATWQGNAGGLGPRNIKVTPSEPAPPLAAALAPGADIPFQLTVRSEVGGGTISGVSMSPHATLGAAGDACTVAAAGSRSPVSASRMKIAPDSVHFTRHVSAAESQAPRGSGALEFFGTYAQGSAQALAETWQSGVALAHEYDSWAKASAALGDGATTVLSFVEHCAQMAYWLDAEATPAEWSDFTRGVAADFVAKTDGVWEGTQTAIQHSVGAWLERVANAYAEGNVDAMFKTLGSSGHGLTAAAVQMAEWELAVGIVKKSGAIGQVIADSLADSTAIDSLKGIRAGRVLTFAEMQKFWGLALEDYQNFKRIAQEEGVLIGVRGRSPISVKNLDEGAVWKHEELKPKNVSPIDIDYLGFDKGDNGLVAMRTYTYDQQRAIRARIAKIVDPSERKAVLARAQTRFGEKKYLDKIISLAKSGEIDVGFNYADNGLVQSSTSTTRGFTLETTKVKGGGEYYRPYQENPALDSLAGTPGDLPASASKCVRGIGSLVGKLLCRVSGDMDGVYLTDPSGRALSAAKRLAVYEKLAAIGWQHPETLTWIKKGLFDFADKTKILSGLGLNGEAMMEFAPDGAVRATYLDLGASRLTSVSDYFVSIAGGYTSYRGIRF